MQINKKILWGLILSYLFVVFFSLYNFQVKYYVINIFSTIFWYRERYYFYIYLFIPLALLSIYLFPKKNLTKLIFVSLSYIFLALIFLNQVIELLYEPDVNAIKVFGFSAALFVFILLHFGMYFMSIKKELIFYMVIVFMSVMLAVIPYSFHLLDSIVDH